MKSLVIASALLLGAPVAYEAPFVLLLALVASVGLPAWRRREPVLNWLDDITNKLGPQLVYLESGASEDWPGERPPTRSPFWSTQAHARWRALCARPLSLWRRAKRTAIPGETITEFASAISFGESTKCSETALRIASIGEIMTVTEIIDTLRAEQRALDETISTLERVLRRRNTKGRSAKKPKLITMPGSQRRDHELVSSSENATR